MPQLVAHLPWGHIRMILDRTATAEERDWYAAAAVQYGWSRNVLLNMMMNRSMERTGAAPSNFTRQLAAADSELPQQMAKDPYNFEFLGLSGEVAEGRRGRCGQTAFARSGGRTCWWWRVGSASGAYAQRHFRCIFQLTVRPRGGRVLNLAGTIL